MDEALQQIKAKYLEMPKVTRTLLTVLAVTTLLPAVGVVSPYRFVLDWPGVFRRFELWRPVTTFFLHGLGINLIFSVMFLRQYSLELETQEFRGRPSDYAWFLILTSASSLMGATALDIPVLSQSLICSIITLWSLRAGTRMVQFYFGITFEAKYFPWALVGFDFVMSGSLPMSQLLGIGSAYAYNWVSTQNDRRQLLSAPAFLRRALPDVRVNPGTASSTSGQSFGTVYNARPGSRPSAAARGVANFREASAAAASHRWGKGQKLGDE